MNKLKFLLILIAALCAANFGFAQVGINTTNPLSMLDINGNLSVKEIGIINANVPGSAPLLGSLGPARTAINDGVYISITPQGVNGANDFELPNAVNVPGRIYIIRNITNCCTAYIFSAGGGLFAKDNFNATAQPLPMAHNNTSKTVIFISDGANWTYIY
jgi:hypothetical protein